MLLLIVYKGHHYIKRVFNEMVLGKNPKRLLTSGKKSVCGQGFSLILNLNA